MVPEVTRNDQPSIRMNNSLESDTSNKKTMISRIRDAKMKNEIKIPQSKPIVSEEQENTNINLSRNPEMKLKESRNTRRPLDSKTLPAKQFDSGSFTQIKSDIDMSSFRNSSTSWKKPLRQSYIGSVLKKGVYQPYLTGSHPTSGTKLSSRKPISRSPVSISPVSSFRNTANWTPVKNMLHHSGSFSIKKAMKRATRATPQMIQSKSANSLKVKKPQKYFSKPVKKFLSNNYWLSNRS